MFDIHYGKYHKIIDASLRELLKTREHPMGDNKGYPIMTPTPELGNYEQIIAKKRFNDLIEKYIKTIKLDEDITPDDLGNFLSQNIQQQLMQSIFMGDALEKPHRTTLEELAIDIIKKDFNIKDGEIIFKVKITGFGGISKPDDMKKDCEGGKEPEVTDENFEYDADQEVHKRRLINALMSGASKKGHYIFHLAKDKLNELDEKLIPVYQLSMVANDLFYYLIPDEMMEMAINESDDSLFAGFEKITFAEDGTPILTVEGVNFPAVLHELIKGVLELIATLALPDDKNMVEYVYDNADDMYAETWYLRLGPTIWERFISCFPPEHINIKSQLLGKLFELDTDDFMYFMRSALSEDNHIAKKQLDTFAREILDEIRQYNQEQN